MADNSNGAPAVVSDPDKTPPQPTTVPNPSPADYMIPGIYPNYVIPSVKKAHGGKIPHKKK